MGGVQRRSIRPIFAYSVQISHPIDIDGVIVGIIYNSLCAYICHLLHIA